MVGASKIEQIGKSVKALGPVKKLDDKVLADIDEILGNKPERLYRRW